MTSVSRRDFLRLSTASGIAAAAGLAIPAGMAVPEIRRIDYSAAPRLRLSVAAFTFRDRFKLDGIEKLVPPDVWSKISGGGGNRKGGKTGKAPAAATPPPDRNMDLFKFVDICDELGFQGAHINTYFFNSHADEYLLRLRRHAYLRGVTISGLAHSTNPSRPSGAARSDEIAATKKYIDMAALMGASYIRVYVGQTNEISRLEADKQAIAAFEEWGEYAGSKGVFIGVENHDVTQYDRLVPMIKAVKSPWVGISIGAAINIKDADLQACLPYLLNYSIWLEPAGPNGEVDPTNFRRVARILREGKYRGWVVLQREGGDPWEISLPRNLKVVREAFAEA